MLRTAWSRSDSVAPQALDPAAERGCVSDDGVARYGLHEHDLLPNVTLRQECLYAAVLVAEHDFQM